MIGSLAPRIRRISSGIARHKKARAQRILLQGKIGWVWSLLRYPVLAFTRRSEKRAFSELISICPANADDARDKLAYLMATMVADRSTVDSTELEHALETLRPYRAALGGWLAKTATPR